MIIEIDKLFFNIVTTANNNKGNKTPVVFLHGFTGCANEWDFIIKNLPDSFHAIAIDLIGHGKTSVPDDVEMYSLQFQLHYLKKIFNRLEIVNPVLVGYSMGGRLALAFADEYQTEIKALVLESTAFGYKTKAEQEERILNDKKLAGLIEKVSLQEFFEYWYDLDLFKTLQKNKNISLEELRKEKIKINNKTGLVNSLIEFSTGKMKNYFDRIMNFRKKVFLITGKLDNKFTQIAIEAKNTFPFAEHRIVNNCGHNVHLEKPEEFLKFLNEFLLNVKENK